MTDTTAKERASWGSPAEFVLACLSYAVGLGNVWRFPYLAYRNGGGAFLIPFLLMLLFIGLPLFYLELYVGQYSRLGPLKAFSNISPFFSGLGYCTLVVISIISIYYMVIVAWTLYYTYVSLFPDLGWGNCFNDYNTDNCFSGQYDQECRVGQTGEHTDLTWFRRSCTSIGSICLEERGLQPLNGSYCLGEDGEPSPWYRGLTRTLASEEFYDYQVLGLTRDTSWSNWGGIQWHLVACLFISWFLAFLVVIRGVRSTGKVVYFTALFPYVMLTALLVRGVTLPGADQGINFYIVPQWETLLNAQVWGDAASQIFYSFGIGCGSLVALASYNKFSNNCHFDAVAVSITNFLTSIFAGFAIFSVLGFLAGEMGVEVDDVATDGVGLAFVAYPEAILQMPAPQVWAILFFFMLFILGLGTQFAGIEAINTAIMDNWPALRNRNWLVTLITCGSCFLLGLPMCFSGGVYLFTVLDWNTASWAILLIGLAEFASVSWSYGIRQALDDLTLMNMKMRHFFKWYWISVWTVIAPVGCFVVFIFVMANYRSASYRDYEFPPGAEALAWMVSLSTLVCFPVGVVLAKRKYSWKQMFQTTSDWGPALDDTDLATISKKTSNAEEKEVDNVAFEAVD